MEACFCSNLPPTFPSKGDETRVNFLVLSLEDVGAGSRPCSGQRLSPGQTYNTNRAFAEKDEWNPKPMSSIKSLRWDRIALPVSETVKRCIQWSEDTAP